MRGFLLDTHTWVWAQTGAADEVSGDFFSDVEAWQASRSLFLSDISVLELARLAADVRLSLGTTVDRFVEEAIADGGAQLLPLTTAALIESTRLPGVIHRDPVDRILVAVAREHGLTLVTRDKALLDYAKRGHLNARKP